MTRKFHSQCWLDRALSAEIIIVEGWNNGLHSRLNGRHPSLAELIDFFQISQNTSKFRIRALITDPLALPYPQKQQVIHRNIMLHDEMRLFYQYNLTTPTSYQDIMNHIDRVINFGILSQQL